MKKNSKTSKQLFEETLLTKIKMDFAPGKNSLDEAPENSPYRKEFLEKEEKKKMGIFDEKKKREQQELLEKQEKDREEKKKEEEKERELQNLFLTKLQKKREKMQNATLRVVNFKTKAIKYSKDNAYNKLTFKETDVNWLFNKTISYIMKKGEKTRIEKYIKKSFSVKKKEKKKKNRPKKPFLFLLSMLSAFRPVLVLNKNIVIEEDKENEEKNDIENTKDTKNTKNMKKIRLKKKRKTRKEKKAEKKKQIWVVSLPTVKKQYVAALLWVQEEIKKKEFEKKKENDIEKKKIFSIKKKIDYVFDEIWTKEKENSFFSKKAEIYTQLIYQQSQKIRKRWK